MKAVKLITSLISVASLVSVPLMCACSRTPDSSNTARVVVLLGQSNMEGFSYNSFLREKSASKYEQYKNGYEDIKISYFSPRNTSQSSQGKFVPTALGQGGQKSCFGPEVGIAEYLSDKNYKSVFLIKYSYSGTSLYENWRSPSSGGQTGKLYTGAVEYVLNAVKVLEDTGYTPVIDAICWMQGESDADKTQYFADRYYDLQCNFIADLRRDFASYANSNGIGFIDAGISDCPLWKYQKTVNDAKSAISELDELNTFFSTIDEKLEYTSEPNYGEDVAHFDSISEIKLGRLFGQNLKKYLNRKAFG